MNNFQRTVKYIAMAFAVVLAIGIVSGIANIVFSVLSVITGHTFENREGTVVFNETFVDVRSLDIDNNYGKLDIKTGDTFRVVAENVSASFEAKVTGDGRLKISDDHRDGLFFLFYIGGFGKRSSRITVYLPEDFIAEEADLDTGAGAVTIEGLNAEKLKISTGAGGLIGEAISAEKAEINGGVGSLILNDVKLSNANIDCGVGTVSIQGTMLGENKVDCGIGEVVLDLSGNADDYDMNIDAGLGSIRLNGKKISGDYDKDNHAAHSLKVDGGVGSVTIDITEQ